jgi:DDE family transposase
MFYHRKDFTNLVSYDRFVSLIKRALPAIVILLDALLGEITDILFTDSTPYKVCHHKRGYRHKVFKGLACKAKSTMGWFYGLKLHFIFNKYGEIVSVLVTPANTDDRKGLKAMSKGLIGKIFGDKGYLGKDFFKELFERGVQVISGIRKNMKNILMNLWDKVYLRRRVNVETIFSSIKSCGTFEHSRHRNVENAFCHIFAALISYQLRPSKPAFFNKTEALA